MAKKCKKYKQKKGKVLVHSYKIEIKKKKLKRR